MLKRQQIHTRKELKEYRKFLRENMTLAEAFLWNFLKAKKLEGKRFTRQHSIGNYIVDFYCASEKLIVELDGQAHLNSTIEEKDFKRTRYLESLGFNVIRFENKMVFDFLPTVLKEIKDNFKTP
ncbi:endonuclease domain-containing protein [Salegentibacter mishustinae]|uniref:Cytosine methyltransferase n=1 Tax=Salegentibacter mishustinae TaxID=270918 RepID=A0A0Q9ZIJ7_9FLAO|nr:cytosine methyltransferase [Salegentibacter mishustinae]PNW22730.1 cytosine methyltransferase [Salegentibacter mishustinae]PZX65092.1 very-short-patch-repair endonuclease [Salegentibacter mishustinae]